MQFRPSSRSSTRSAHNSPTIHAHMNMDMNVQENHNSSPLRTISCSNSNSNSNTSTRLFRNSATNVMRTIIDSPRRALLNRKKRLSAHHHQHRHNQNHNHNQNRPDESKIMAKSSPILQHYDENYVQVHSHSSLGCQDVDVNMNLNMHMPMQIHMNMNTNMHGNNMKRSTNMNMSLFWLEYHAPQDIVPKVLSFAGPQMIQILSRVSKSWNDTCLSEAVFRTLSEDTGKWVKGTHEEPQLQCDMNMHGDGHGHEHEYGKTKPAFWRNYYRDNPIVPLDYRTIPDALAGVCTRKRFKDQTYYECDRDVRILLHPALYSLKSRVVVETLADATFAVETHNHYCRNRFHAPNSIAPLVTSSSRSRCNSDGSASASGSPPAATKRRLNGPGLREIFNCRTSQAAEDTSDEGSRRSRSRSRSGSLGTGSGSGSGSYHKRDATIVLRTRADNTPIFHIRQGRMRLSRMNLIHECTGVDIWNGNAAVQIQPRHEERANHHPVPVVPQAPHRPPSALVEDSKIMSVSGRGIVAIDGSAAYLRKCHIYKCAATGVYVGGPGSTANVLFCDIVQNGIGNVRAGRRRPRGRTIARGHSGFYLEQGRAVLQDCNVSRNALTGISAVSPTNAILEVRDSDIVANGTLQIELPPQGSISYRKASNVNNRISKDGQARVRSGFKLSEMEEPQASASEEDDHASNMSESEDW